jgi:hypothetical protein
MKDQILGLTPNVSENIRKSVGREEGSKNKEFH